MATDFSKPVVTDGYAALLAGIATAMQDLAMGLEPTLTGASTNVPTGAKRWNAAASYWERYTGASWVTLPAAGNLYAINVGGNAATATLSVKSTHIAGGLVGQIPYQTAADTTALLAAGTLGQVLLSGGAAAPTWGNAVANLAGGLVGQIPYQSGANTTAFLAAGTAGQIMTCGGGAAPTWGSALPGDAVINTFAVGYRDVPQNSKSAAYTTVLGDAGQHIYHPSADTTARIWTIPANASVAYPIGTAITFVNDTSAGVVTIAITTDVMVLAGAGTTGSRTLSANGIATVLKITATRWMISGSGLT